MPTPALLLLIATLLPLASFVLLVFMGKRMGKPLAGWMATAFIMASCALSLAAMIAWLNNGQMAGVSWGPGDKPIELSMAWLPSGSGIGQYHPGFLDLTIYIDSLTIAMFNLVTLVALLVHIFSLGYMADDPRYARFFTYLGLFCFSMLGLVLGGTVLQLFIFWELVGLCSYLLIGFWYEARSACRAAIKAFLVNRIGDVGFLIGLGILFYHLGNVTLPQMDRWLGGAGSMVHGGMITLPSGMTMSATMLTVMGIGLFFGAMGKSAQFPLHVWLPDAMEGPTPVSALIHAATMVAAGVYLMARIFPILTPDAKLFVAVIGLITLTMGSLIALVQDDIKQVLAFSTVSQLGYMMMAIGIGSWVGALFHLMTHAFFKALLFLAAGSVIHAAEHEQEMSQFGGLMRKLPVTAATFGVGVLAISGTPFFSGYYSKELILSHAGAFAQLAANTGHSGAYWLFFILPTIAAYLTAFYMTRVWMLTFWGTPRNPALYAQARETTSLWYPLIALAGLSIIGGSQLLDIKHLLVLAVNETENYVNTLPGPVVSGQPAPFTGFSQSWPVVVDVRTSTDSDMPDLHPPTSETGNTLEERGEQLVGKYAVWAFAVGIGLGIVMYARGYAVATALTRIWPLGLLHEWLSREMYFDELYQGLFVGVLLMVSRAAGLFDRLAVDGVVNLLSLVTRKVAKIGGLFDGFIVDGAVSGVASATRGVGTAARATQTGRIRVYITAVIALLTLGVAVAVFTAMKLAK